EGPLGLRLLGRPGVDLLLAQDAQRQDAVGGRADDVEHTAGRLQAAQGGDLALAAGARGRVAGPGPGGEGPQQVVGARAGPGAEQDRDDQQGHGHAGPAAGSSGTHGRGSLHVRIARDRSCSNILVSRRGGQRQVAAPPRGSISWLATFLPPLSPWGSAGGEGAAPATASALTPNPSPPRGEGDQSKGGPRG